MSAGTLISLEEYLHTSYSPDREYRDGVVVERNVGELAHARLQGRLMEYFGRFRKQWKVEAFPELRIRVRANSYPIPDICVYRLPMGEERYPPQPPFLWIEILSEDDRVREVWERAGELLKWGVPYFWLIDPVTLESELRTPEGILPVRDKILRLPDSPIVIPLAEAAAE